MPITTEILPVSGMHCASCASTITRKVKKIPGVSDIRVNIGTEKAAIAYDPKAVTVSDLNHQISKLGYRFVQENETEKENAVHGNWHHTMDEKQHDSNTNHTHHHVGNQNKAEKLKELAHQKKLVLFTLPFSGLMFAFSLWDIGRTLIPGAPELPIPMDLMNLLLFLLATIVFIVAGRTFILGIIRFLRYGSANMDTLVGIGTVSAYLYSTAVTFSNLFGINFSLPLYTYFDVSIVIIGFILLGKYLESKSKLQTGEAIEKLLTLQAKTVIVERNNTEKTIPIEELVVGDIFLVRAGDTVAVDGEIIFGNSSLDESMITGESLPVDKKVNDQVIGGTISKQGFIRVKATKIGKETMLMRIVKMVEDAQGSKAPIEALADTVSAVFVPIVLIIALVTFLAWIGAGILGWLPIATAFSLGFISTVGVLVIACPCALGLATPTAIITATGRGARSGILLKDAISLQQLQTVTAVLFDKTGTLTRGIPQVTDIFAFQTTTEKLLQYAASLEKNSSHPLASAVVTKASKKQLSLLPVTDLKIIEGKGIQGIVDAQQITIGNESLFSSTDIPKEVRIEFDRLSQQGKTCLIVAVNSNIIGILALADVVKGEAKKVIETLHKQKIHVAMVTGDHPQVAKSIAKELRIDTVFAQVLPGQKAEKVQELQDKGFVVAFVGDGINDAPALAKADVGIAMGSGTDIAIETANITLLAGNLEKLTNAISLSKKAFKVITQNLVWAFGYNIIGIPIAAGILYPLWGITLNPIIAGAAMALSSVSVVVNSLRLQRTSI